MNFIDKHVGKIVRARRESLSFSRVEFAGLLSISTRELQAREAGRSRFGPGDLQVVCDRLELRPKDIYSGLLGEAKEARPCPLCGSPAASAAAGTGTPK